MPAMMAANIILFMILLTLGRSILRNRQKKNHKFTEYKVKLTRV